MEPVEGYQSCISWKSVSVRSSSLHPLGACEEVRDQKVAEPEEKVPGGKGLAAETFPHSSEPLCPPGARRDADPVTGETGGTSARLASASAGAVQGTGGRIEGRTEGTTDVMIGGMDETTAGALQQAHSGGG